MTSKIINMAERLKDEEDLRLEAMFRSEPVADNGFAVDVVKRVRARIWVRRLSLPVAVSLGLLVGARSLIEFVGIASGLVEPLLGASLSLEALPLGSLPQASTIVIGATCLMVIMLASRILEE